jgi:hypothetical protein
MIIVRRLTGLAAITAAIDVGPPDFLKKFQTQIEIRKLYGFRPVQFAKIPTSQLTK